MPDLKPFEDSDDEVEERAHKNLLENVNRLSKTQFIKKPTRTEPAAKVSEFSLSRPSTATADAQKDPVNVNDLVKTLKRSKKHLSTGKELRKIQQNKKVLKKPLEKPVRDRIQRKLGYERAKTKLDKWNALVTLHQATDHLSFPLNAPDKDVEIIDGKSVPSNFRIKTDLMKEMEVIYPSLATVHCEETKPPIEQLSKEEMILRSREMRAQRIRESQRSAKAHFQNKIKSKKFHKIMKKQKIKEQLKEFETLQKTNPDLALQKLDEFEKNRVLERALLRHKNTGTWAKNLQVRSKYDKSVRQDLAQQLALSRELTQKKQDADKDDDDDDDEKEDVEEIAEDPFNPWLKKSNENDLMQSDKPQMSGYRKYWEERNRNEVQIKKYNEDLNALEKRKIELQEMDEISVAKLSKKKKSRKATIENGWKVEDCDETKNIADDLDDLFDNAEDKMQKKITQKMNRIKNKLSESENIENTPKQRRKQIKSNHSDLSFKTKVSRPNIDEELLESTSKSNRNELKNNLDTLKIISNVGDTNNSIASNSHPTVDDNINPNNFMNIKVHHLNTAMPDMDHDVDEHDDDDDGTMAAETARRMTITEAFADDDIVADFRQEKDDERQKNGPNEIDLTLPGWGSWAGHGLKARPKKVVLKFAATEKRRDENKGDVVIIESENKKLKDHLVSALPFPFTAVKDFESSIRAPIGRDFIPAVASTLLTKPAIITQMGAIIEPIQKSMLLQKPIKRIRSKTEKKIAAL